MDWSKVLSRGATGAAVGSAGGPGWGTVIGGVAGLGEGFLESLFGGGDDDAGKKYIEDLQFQDPRNDPAYAAALDKLRSYATGTVQAEDRAREAHALGEAEQFAQGQTGAVRERAQAQGGGNLGLLSVLENQNSQSAATRLSKADTDTAAMASERGRLASDELMKQLGILTQMQNQFAMMKAGKLSDIASSEQAARNANINATVGDVANLTGMAVRGTKPKSAPVATGAAGNPGGDSYGAVMPQSRESQVFDPRLAGGFLSTLASPESGATTASAAARQYALSPDALEAYPSAQRKVITPDFSSSVSYGR